jgi:hypothetical protein
MEPPETGQEDGAGPWPTWALTDRGKTMWLRAMRGGAVTAIVLLLLTSTACGQDNETPQAKSDQSSPPSTPSSTPTASPSSSADAPTKPTIPITARTPAGRIAFARYFLAAYAYGLGTDDPTAMMAVALPNGPLVCASCTAYARYLKKQKAKGQVRRPWQLPIKHTRDRGQVRNGLYVVNLLVDRPALVDVDAAGHRHRPQKEYPNYLFQIGMTWSDHTWKATGWLEHSK